jgi:hypothetical protein
MLIRVGLIDQSYQTGNLYGNIDDLRPQESKTEISGFDSKQNLVKFKNKIQE